MGSRVGSCVGSRLGDLLINVFGVFVMFGMESWRRVVEVMS